MKIRTKLLSITTLMAVVPLALLALALGKVAIDEMFIALEAEQQRALTASREQKKQQIQGYFSNIESQALTFSGNLMVVEAAQSLKDAFFEERQYSPSLELQSYYSKDFSSVYKKRNVEGQINTDSILNNLSPEAIYWQDQYIAQNPNPLGSKDNLNAAADQSIYSEYHEKYHPVFREYLNQFGFYDIFLVDPRSGHIFYSVFKELDYATSLKTGPYADSQLAEAFNQANSFTDNQQTYLTDFKPYLPSYMDPAAFISTPVFEQGKKVAILIFQMPIDNINNIMTSNAQWKDMGFGDSGETYLVGNDFTMRNQSRFLIEDKAAYLSALRAGGQANQAEIIDRKETSIGLQQVNSPGVKAALSGQSGFQEYTDYRQELVYSAYAPVIVGGQKWAILSEIDKQEALGAAYVLKQKVLNVSTLITLVMIIIVSAAGIFFAKSLTDPLHHLIDNLKDIATGGADLTRHLEEAERTDEIGELGRAFNLFNQFIKKLIMELKETAESLAASSIQLQGSSEIAMDSASKQKSQTEMVAAAVEQFHMSIKEVANNTERSSETSENADSISRQSADFAEEARVQIDKLVHGVDSASGVISQLSGEVDEIKSILSVIDEIAEQTNLLALNAAIEAARAGEHGRGFSVVADEVRSLAARTQESTVEVQNRINSLETAANKAVSSMDVAASMAQSGIDLVSQVRTRLSDVSGVIANLSEMNATIATAANQQKFAADSVSESISSIDEYAQSNAALTQQVKISTEELNHHANSLAKLVSRFKIA